MFQSIRHPSSRLKLALHNLGQRINAASQRPRRLRELNRLVRNRLGSAVCWPSFSLICPMPLAASDLLRVTVRSLIGQPYPHWELILVGSAASLGPLQMEKLGVDDTTPIRLAEAPAEATVAERLNLGLEKARGAWCAFLEAGDRLTIDALSWAWLQLERTPQVCWMYTDESRSTRRGKSFNHKPDFSPELLLSQMFTGNLSLFSRDTVMRAGALKDEFGGACLYDLCLRLSEDLPPSKIAHIPYALFQRGPGPAAFTGTERFQPEDLRALAAALERRSVRATVSRSGLYPRIRFVPIRQPHVTVVIPTRNSADLLVPCVQSLRRQTNYGNYEILVIDNQSDDPTLLDYLAAQQEGDDFRVFRYDRPFNHSEMHNQALATVDSEFVVLLNNDVDRFSSGWLEELVATAELGGDIAGVGAKLLFPNNTIQHGGIVLGLRGLAAHSHARQPQDSDGYFGRLVSLQQYSGATAALLLLRTAAYWSVSGFDADAFPTSYNDVDLWLRLRRAGYRCIYNPSVTACHYEGKTRRPSHNEDEYGRRLTARWAGTLRNDPFYNISLSTRCEFVKDFGVDSLRSLLGRLPTEP
jgi:GT2 family glycosyltransferase